MIAAYPWLSFAMASCCYLALFAWFVDSVSALYRGGTLGFDYDQTVSDLMVGVIFGCLHRAIPFIQEDEGRRS